MSTPQQNALALWRERQAAAKVKRVAELDRFRQSATTEDRDGREWTVVHLPDNYSFVTRLRVKV